MRIGKFIALLCSSCFMLAVAAYIHAQTRNAGGQRLALLPGIGVQARQVEQYQRDQPPAHRPPLGAEETPAEPETETSEMVP